MIHKIQVAVQGGGARLITLLAAMEALQNLEHEQKIQVTRVAGTSAGAIAAALFAARVPMLTARTLLKARKQELLNSFVLNKGWITAAKLARGKALWSNSLLESLLRDLLKHGQSNSQGRLDGNCCIRHLPIPFFTVATDLNTLQPHNFGADDGVIQSIMCSAALPFLFRALNSKPSSPVDGGICDNLPASLLTPGEEEFGPTIGLSFFPDRPTQPPQNVADYAFAIINTAINHATERTRMMLSTRCILLPTTIQTLDFPTALGPGLEEAYDLSRREATDEINKVVRALFGAPKSNGANNHKTAPASSSPTRVPPEVRTGSHELSELDWKPAAVSGSLAKKYGDTLDAIGKMYKRQHHHQTLRYLRSRVIVTANGLDLTRSPGHDQITSLTVIATDKDTVYCHRVALGQSDLPETILDESEIRVVNSRGERVSTIIVPMNTTEDRLVREVLVCFDPVLTPQTGPYHVSCTSLFSDFLRPLRENGADDMELVLTRADALIPLAEIVLRYPQSFGNVVFTGSSCSCEPMSQDELQPYQDGAPPGYFCLGWQARNVKERFCVSFEKRAP